MEIMVNILRLLMMKRISPKQISYSGDDRHGSKNRVMETSISGCQDISRRRRIIYPPSAQRPSPFEPEAHQLLAEWDHPLYFSKLNLEILSGHLRTKTKMRLR